jgi:magnesium-transporting ATPase (P-type)
MIPGDVRILASKDLFVSQGALTGESLPVEKHPKLPISQLNSRQPLELDNLCFMGTSVISGTASAVVIETGAQTYLGSLAEEVTGQRGQQGKLGRSLLLCPFGSRWPHTGDATDDCYGKSFSGRYLDVKEEGDREKY